MKRFFEGYIYINCDCGNPLLSFHVDSGFLTNHWSVVEKVFYCSDCGRKVDVSKIKKSLKKDFKNIKFDLICVDSE